MPESLRPVFARLRDLLKAHADDFDVAHDTTARYGLKAPIGPATLRSWGGKMKTPTIPVAWVEQGKSYVSYHLMGISGNAALVAALSESLRARMQGKSCFNFKSVDDALFQELEHVTTQSLRGMRTAGYVSDKP
jgi:hypothetical protein